MTNKVIISIKGIQHEFGEDGVTEVIITGSYYLKGGKHYIIYDELIPETGEQIRNTIKIAPERADVIKHGRSHDVHMVFEPGVKNLAFYHTPYGVMEISTNAFSVDVEESEENISAKIEYALDINDGFVSDCTIEIGVQAIKE